MWIIALGEIRKNILNGNVFIACIVLLFLFTTSFYVLHENELGFLSRAAQPVMSISEQVNPLFSEFQAPDIQYLVMFIASLMVIAFSYNAISGERQNGTLQLLLSNSVPRYTVIMGKWLLTFLNIAVPFIFAMLFIMVFASFFQKIHLQTIILITLASFLYLSVFVGITLFVSVVTKSPKNSAICGLLLWVLFIFILPSSGKLIAEFLADVPSIDRVEWQNEVIWGILDFRVHNEEGFDYKTASEEMKAEAKNARTHKQNKEMQLLQFTRNLAHVSPAGSFRFLMTGLVKAASIEKVREKETDMELPGYHIESFHFSSQDILIEYAILIIYSIMFFVLTYVIFVRYDVRAT